MDAHDMKVRLYRALIPAAFRRTLDGAEFWQLSWMRNTDIETLTQRPENNLKWSPYS